MSGCSSNRNYHMSNQESWDVIGTRSLAKPVVLTSCSYLMTCESARWVSTPSPTMVPFSRTEIVLLASVGDICLFDFKTHVNGRSKKKGVPATGCCGVYSDMDSHCYQPSHWQHWYGLLGLVGILILELDPREIVPIKVDDLPIQHDHGNHGSSATRGDSHHHLQKKNMLRHAGASDTFVWPSFLDILSAIQLAVVGYWSLAVKLLVVVVKPVKISEKNLRESATTYENHNKSWKMENAYKWHIRLGYRIELIE